MRKYRLSLILLGLLIITLFSSFQITNVKAQSTLEYEFKQNILIDTENVIFDGQFNIGTKTYVSQNYSGTYSFTDDVDGSDPIDWIVNSEASGSIEVVSDKENYDKVLMLYDNDNGVGCNIEQIFSSEIYGTVEYWFLTDDASYRNYFYLMGITDLRFQVYVYTETFWYYDGATHDTTVDCFDNTWYHLRVDFEHGAGSYLGLSADTWNLWINGVKIGTYSFSTAGGTADRIVLATATPDLGYRGYYDAISYSWDENYNIHDNIIPETFDLGIETILGYEWIFDDDGTAFVHGTVIDDPCGWIDTNPYDTIRHYISEYNYKDMTLRWESNVDYTYTAEISQDFNSATGFYNLSWHLNYDRMENDAGGEFKVEINSFDETLLTEINILTDAVDSTLRYYDGSGYIDLESENIHDDYNYTFNLFIDSRVSIGYLSVSENDISLGNYSIPLCSVKDGLGTITIGYDTKTDSPIDITELDLNYFRVFNNGTSLYENGIGYGYIECRDDVERFFMETYNLLSINASGTFSIIVSSFGFYETLVSTETHNNTNKFYNHYDTVMNQTQGIPDPKLIFTVKGTNNLPIINSIIIEGIKLTQGVNEYFPSIIDGSVNNSVSYFRVDSFNRLVFSLTVNDNNSEYLEISFNIPDIQSENRSLSFRSNINGQSQGFFRVNYTDDTSTFLPFPVWLSTTNVILPQTKEIDKIGILITDNDNDDNDVCSGYITNVQLIYIPDMTTSIITLNLVMVIVPIIVLLVPTIGVSARYGKNTILPMFILMSIICVATELIPMWLFFIIALSSGAFLFMKRNRSDI